MEKYTCDEFDEACSCPYHKRKYYAKRVYNVNNLIVSDGPTLDARYAAAGYGCKEFDEDCACPYHKRKKYFDNLSKKKEAEKTFQLAEENLMLRQELEQHRQQIQHQSLQLKSMQDQQTTSEDKQTMDLLKAQIKLMTEDFEAEKRDRQTACQKLSVLERDHANLKERLSSYQSRQYEDLMDSRRRALDKHDHQAGGGHLYADGEADTTAQDGYDEIDKIDYPFPLFPECDEDCACHRVRKVP